MNSAVICKHKRPTASPPNTCPINVLPHSLSVAENGNFCEGFSCIFSESFLTSYTLVLVVANLANIK